MKWFCSCNSKFIETFDTLRNPSLRTQFCDYSITDNSDRCPICGDYKWNDPWYENEMFDLKIKEKS